MVVAIKTPIVVMALYDIGRDSWNSFTLSYNTYLHWMKNTLSLDCKFVIYTEEKFQSKIKKMRREFDPDFSSTEVIVQPLEELECYKKYYEKMSEVMFSEDFKKESAWNNVPEMTQPLYNIIMFSKIDFIKHAKDNNYFDGDFYIWADAGGLRESINNYKDEVWPSLNKVNQLDNSKITFFSHSKAISIDDNKKHAISQVRHIQGTAFFVPKNSVDEFHIDFNKTISECLSKNFIGSDEKILDITYCKNKENYNLIKCGWREYFKIFKNDGFDLFAKKDKSNKVLIDLGSYNCASVDGLMHKAEADSSWSIFLFEPNPLLNKTVQLEENIKLFKKAAWKRNGRTILNQYEENGKGQGSLLEETNAGRDYMDYFGECVVDCVDFHEFLLKLKDKEIWMNVDIEYSEYELIEHLLDNGWPENIKKIWIEWHGKEINKNKINYLTKKIKEKGTEIENL